MIISSDLKVSDLLKGDIKLASPPALYFALKKIIEDPGKEAKHAASVIENDPALAGKLLKIVNSAFYGFSQQITSITKAVTLIGTRELQNLSLNTLLIERFSDLPGQNFDIHTFWARNLRCALLSREFDAQLGKVYAESAFICGLIHNIGQLLFHLRIPELARQIDLLLLSAGQTESRDEISIETQVVGFDHYQAGAELCRLWKLPEIIIESIALHGFPEHTDHYAGIAAIVRLCSSISAANPYQAITDRNLGLTAGQIGFIIDKTNANLMPFSNCFILDNRSELFGFLSLPLANNLMLIVCIINKLCLLEAGREGKIHAYFSKVDSVFYSYIPADIIGRRNGYVQLGAGSALDNIGENWLPRIQHSSALKSALLDFRNRETQLLISRSPAEINETVGRMADNFADFKNQEQALLALLTPTDEADFRPAYLSKVNAYFETHRRLEIMVREDKQEEAMTYFRTGSRQAFRELLPVIDKLVANSISAAAQARVAAKSVSANATIMIITATLAALLAALGLNFWLYHATIPELRKIDTVTANMAKNLDFSLRVEIDSQDEVGETAASVNRVATSIQSAMQKLSEGISQNAETANQLLKTAQQAARSSEQESSAASNMAAAVEELTVSIQQVAENARRAFNLSHHAGETARQGNSVIAESIRHMQDVATRIQQTAASIEQLGKASLEISGIIQIIKEVADQTNLLALNAAIEAARAGDQGRGFAVVADEVRHLSERTSLATSDISAKIAGIRSGVESAAANMGVVVTLVENGVSIMDNAEKSIQLINNHTLEVETEVNAISDALRARRSQQ